MEGQLSGAPGCQSEGGDTMQPLKLQPATFPAADPVEALADIKGMFPKSLAAAVEPLLVPAGEAARLCGISEATWFRLKAAGKTPAPVKLGGRVLYRVEDLRLW